MAGDYGRLIAAHSEAQRFYREQLLASAVAQGPCHYLSQRRLAHVLSPDSNWQVGYAPPHWTELRDYLTHLGFDEEELLAAGLVCHTLRGGVIDRFRDRIMLPQRHELGHVIGFVGRAAPGAPVDVPKYLNSPHTRIYHKSELLFGLHEQRQAIATSSRLALVEGPLDVLAIAGTEVSDQRLIPAVAPCGVALTREQVERLVRRLAPGAEIVVAYDNDRTGRRATADAFQLLADCLDVNSHALLAARMPRGTDPAELLQVHGSTALRTALSDPSLPPLAERAMSVRLDEWAHVLDGIDGRIAAVKDVATLLRGLPEADVADQVAKLAGHVDLDPVTVSIAVTDELTTNAGHVHTAGAKRPGASGAYVPQEVSDVVPASRFTL